MTSTGKLIMGGVGVGETPEMPAPVNNLAPAAAPANALAR
jgi:hypothetical protein